MTSSIVVSQYTQIQITQIMKEEIEKDMK